MFGVRSIPNTEHLAKAQPGAHLESYLAAVDMGVVLHGPLEAVAEVNKPLRMSEDFRFHRLQGRRPRPELLHIGSDAEVILRSCSNATGANSLLKCRRLIYYGYAPLAMKAGTSAAIDPTPTATDEAGGDASPGQGASAAAVRRVRIAQLPR